jgi:hypothetical protein
MWHLTWHFFGAMFDFGVLTPAGADSFTHLLLGGVGALIAVGLGATRVYAGKYAALSSGASAEPYRLAVLGDDLFLIGLPMLVVALATLLVSQSLFPDERDFRILGPLPVRRIVIVGAKLASLFLFTAMFLAVLHLALTPLMLLISFSRFSADTVLSRLASWLIASVIGSLFAMLAIAAAVGIVTLVLSRTRLHSLTALARSLLLTSLVVSVPFVFWLPNAGQALARHSAWLTILPPAWFVGLERFLLGNAGAWFTQLAQLAIGGFAGAAVIVGAVYALLFRRFEHLLLRPRAISALRFWQDRDRTARAAPIALNRVTTIVPSSPFRAVYRFVIATVARSQLHQGVLLGLSACGLAIVLNRLVGAHTWARAEIRRPTEGFLLYVSLWAPFALMFLSGLSVRAAIALPMIHRANWIFRLTESDATRREQMRAVDWIVTLYVVGLPVLVAVPVFWSVLPPLKATIAVITVSLIGTLFAHGVLLEWRRIPFTCSYMPGKRMVVFTVVPSFAAFVLFTNFSVLLAYAANQRPVYAVVIGTVLAAVSLMLRRSRLAEWKQTPLMFDDELPDQPLQLGL